MIKVLIKQTNKNITIFPYDCVVGICFWRIFFFLRKTLIHDPSTQRMKGTGKYIVYLSHFTDEEVKSREGVLFFHGYEAS